MAGACFYRLPVFTVKSFFGDACCRTLPKVRQGGRQRGSCILERCHNSPHTANVNTQTHEGLTDFLEGFPVFLYAKDLQQS
jgi:hypothetical protein